MSPASTHTTDQAGTRSKHKTLSVLPGWPTATHISVRIQRQNWPYSARSAPNPSSTHSADSAGSPQDAVEHVVTSQATWWHGGMAIQRSTMQRSNMVPLPSPPRWVPYVAAAVWLLLVVLLAVVSGRNGFDARLIGILLGTVAPVAFAAAGGALLVERWQRREWDRRTRYIVVTLVDDALDVLKVLATTVYDVVVGALPDKQQPSVRSLEPAFRVPLSDTQRDSMRAAIVITKGVLSALQGVYENAAKQAKRAERASTELW